MKYYSFDLHPCQNYHKTTHSSNKCFKNKPPIRAKIHIGWIASWQWDSIAKNIFQSYVRTCYTVLNNLVVEYSPSSHLLSHTGEVMIIFKSTSSEPDPQPAILDSELWRETKLPLSMPLVGGQP